MGWQGRTEGDGPELHAYWLPFLRAARRTREDGVPWVLDPLDFAWAGPIERKRPGDRLWAYRHFRTRGFVFFDGDGQPFDVRPDRAGRLRTRPITTSTAAWRAGLPEDQLAQEPPHNGLHEGWETCAKCAAWMDREDELLAPRRRRRPATATAPPTPRLRIVR